MFSPSPVTSLSKSPQFCQTRFISLLFTYKPAHVYGDISMSCINPIHEYQIPLFVQILFNTKLVNILYYSCM